MTNFKDKILGKSFVGIIEENIDPDRKLRLKIRIPYFHGTKKQIPTDHLPWSLPNKKTSQSSYVPDINKIINVTFPTGEILFPVYDGVEHFDINLQKKIDNLDDTGYTKFISICYNYNTQIFISTDGGLNMFHKKTGIQITDNGDIITRLDGNSSSYYIGDENSSQAALLGNNWIDYMDKLMKALPTAYLDSNGIACMMTPNMLSVVQQYNLLKKNFISNNVFISDNDTISDSNINTVRQTGDKYETINETEEVNIIIEELEKKEEREEIKKIAEKQQFSDEKTDEILNKEDGLINPKNKKELDKHIKENLNMVTENVVVAEETTSEGTEAEEDAYYEDFSKINNIDNNADSNAAQDSTSDATDNSYQDSYWDSQYYYPPEPSEGGGSSVNGGVVVYGKSAGVASKRVNINTKIEKLDMSILPKPGWVSHFLKYSDVIWSKTAHDAGIKNTPDNNDHLRNLVKISRSCYDPTLKFFKEHFGYAVALNSAYRNEEVNALVGGVSSSQHKTGSALDLMLYKPATSNSERKVMNNLLFYYLKHHFKYYGQLIWEDNNGDGPEWCHIALNNAGKTRNITTAAGGVMKEPNAHTVKTLKELGVWKPELETKNYV